MKRRVFYSFHYERDHWRASQVRNMGVIEGNEPVSDNDWETVKRGGAAAIKHWINAQLSERSCTIVLVGAETAQRPWVKYEIVESWNKHKGVVGIHIHSLLDSNKRDSPKGSNPFAGIYFDENNQSLSIAVECFDPGEYSSQACYEAINSKLALLVEKAIANRQRFSSKVHT